MLAEISAGLSSLKAAKDIVQGLSAAKTEAAVVGAKIELQGHILEAQQGLFAAQEAQSSNVRRIAELESIIARQKDWSAERERYLLADTGSGALAYSLKDPVEGESQHYLCAHCFEEGNKSILQPEVRMPGRDEFLVCHRCKGELLVQGSTRAEHHRRR